MDKQSIDYHLEKARDHLNSALTDTKSYMEEYGNIPLEEELGQTWNQFLLWMFGDAEQQFKQFQHLENKESGGSTSE